MSTRKTIIVLEHDEGYGDDSDVLRALNTKLGSGDMVARSAVSETNFTKDVSHRIHSAGCWSPEFILECVESVAIGQTALEQARAGNVSNRPMTTSPPGDLEAWIAKLNGQPIVTIRVPGGELIGELSVEPYDSHRKQIVATTEDPLPQNEFPRSAGIPDLGEFHIERQHAAINVDDRVAGATQAFEQGFDTCLAFICRINTQTECFCGCHNSTTVDDEDKSQDTDRVKDMLLPDPDPNACFGCGGVNFGCLDCYQKERCLIELVTVANLKELFEGGHHWGKFQSDIESLKEQLGYEEESTKPPMDADVEVIPLVEAGTHGVMRADVRARNLERNRVVAIIMDEYEYWRDERPTEDVEVLDMMAMGSMGAASNILARVMGMTLHRDA